MSQNKINILLVGDYQTPVYTGIYGSYKRAFEALNINTIDFYFNINLKLVRYAKFSHLMLKLLVQNEQKRFLNFASQNSITHILVFKGSYLLPDTIEKIKKNGISIANYNPDNPFNKVKSSSNDIIKEAINHYDYYFIWSKNLVDLINKNYQTKAYYLPFAVDDTLIKFNFNFNTCNYKYPVSFIGNADKERMNQIKTLITKYPQLNTLLILFGDGWSLNKSLNIHNQLKGADYFQTISQSKINLNILRKQNKNAHNMRTFEIPACGGFMLHEYSNEAIELFKPDKEAVYYYDISDCFEKIQYYLQNDTVRIKIAQAGYARATSFENTYIARAKRILNIFNEK